MAKRAKFSYHEIQDGGGRHIKFQKMSISGLDEDISTQFGGGIRRGHWRWWHVVRWHYHQLQDGFEPIHVLDRLSDDYNFSLLIVLVISGAGRGEMGRGVRSGHHFLPGRARTMDDRRWSIERTDEWWTWCRLPLTVHSTSERPPLQPTTAITRHIHVVADCIHITRKLYSAQVHWEWRLRQDCKSNFGLLWPNDPWPRNPWNWLFYVLPRGELC